MNNIKCNFVKIEFFNKIQNYVATYENNPS